MKRIIGRKAEWLKGDGGACIRTISKITSDIELKFKYPLLERGNECRILSFDSADRMNQIALTSKGYDKLAVTINKGNYNSILSITTEGDNNHTVMIDDGKLCLNEKEYPFDFSDIKVDTTSLFNWNRESSSVRWWNGYISYLRISNSFKLTPIVLTLDIPYTLASDNLPHAAGECGMWDSVNEKFYGNANSTGAFSVENELDEYVEVDLTGICINGKYQRVAVENTEIPQIVWNGVNAKMLMLNGKVVWLTNYIKFNNIKMSGYCYIETDIVAEIGDELRCEYIVTARAGSPSNILNYIFGGKTINNKKITNYVNHNKNNKNENENVLGYGVPIDNYYRNGYSGIVSSNSTSYTATLNNNFLPQLRQVNTAIELIPHNPSFDITAEEISQMSFTLGAYINNVGAINESIINSFEIVGKHKLVPCLVPCKNKAGEIGMIDEITHRFYKCSGTGTAEVYN